MYGRFGIALIKHTSTRVAVTVCWPSTWFTSCVTCLTGVGHLVVKHSTGTFSYTWWAQEKLWETAWKALIALMTKACLACWATWNTAIEYKQKCNGVEENIHENRTIWLCALGNCSRSGNLEIMISMKLWSCKIIRMQKHGKWFFSTVGFSFLCNNNCIIIIQTKLGRTSSIYTALLPLIRNSHFTDKAFY